MSTADGISIAKNQTTPSVAADSVRRTRHATAIGTARAAIEIRLTALKNAGGGTEWKMLCPAGRTSSSRYRAATLTSSGMKGQWIATRPGYSIAARTYT